MALKTFDIPVCRIGYGFATITVKAKDQKEAEALALDQAGDHEYSEKNSDYVIEGAEDRVQKLLDLSTSHVSNATRELLESEYKLPVRYVKHEHGWLFFLSSIDKYINEQEFDAVPELRALMTEAVKRGCSYINFDSDADILEGFETFDW